MEVPEAGRPERAAAEGIGATSAVSVTSLSLLGGLAMTQKLVYAAIAAALLATTGLFVALDGLEPTSSTFDPIAAPDDEPPPE